jgi:hypothetical protein
MDGGENVRGTQNSTPMGSEPKYVCNKDELYLMCRFSVKRTYIVTVIFAQRKIIVQQVLGTDLSCACEFEFVSPMHYLPCIALGICDNGILKGRFKPPEKSARPWMGKNMAHNKSHQGCKLIARCGR